ncbi:MAG: class I SAM-dependent methyltransferase [Polyangiaceae bacterium]|nr:class I SAM-dependent methyltransferase [Polyangiaceae bacterium]
MQHVVARRDGWTLLLGVTPELAAAALPLVAIDRDPEMIRELWPGDGAERRAVAGDWRALPFESGSFGAALGDGSLNVLASGDDQRAVLAELGRVLAARGRAALRVFCRPVVAERRTDLLRAAERGAVPCFHALKWRVAMSLAAERDGRVAVRDILEAFPADPGERHRLAGRAGWQSGEMLTLDVYRGSSAEYVFPTREELERRLPREFSRAEWIEVAGYPLAERCPLWVLDRA